MKFILQQLPTLENPEIDKIHNVHKSLKSNRKYMYTSFGIRNKKDILNDLSQQNYWNNKLIQDKYRGSMNMSQLQERNMFNQQKFNKKRSPNILQVKYKTSLRPFKVRVNRVSNRRNHNRSI
mmetsp:Transcript_14834/g.13037  ORF Transcript_14834/g.13037 Transcript_14834/m.13037 type:complete len:122 (+) Transcript_14834:816-1181(+)